MNDPDTTSQLEIAFRDAAVRAYFAHRALICSQETVQSVMQKHPTGVLTFTLYTRWCGRLVESQEWKSKSWSKEAAAVLKRLKWDGTQNLSFVILEIDQDAIARDTSDANAPVINGLTASGSGSRSGSGTISASAPTLAPIPAPTAAPASPPTSAPTLAPISAPTSAPTSASTSISGATRGVKLEIKSASDDGLEPSWSWSLSDALDIVTHLIRPKLRQWYAYHTKSVIAPSPPSIGSALIAPGLSEGKVANTVGPSNATLTRILPPQASDYVRGKLGVFAYLVD